MKYTLHKNGAFAWCDRPNGGMWVVKLRAPNGELHQKMRCETYKDALNQLRAFNAIAKTLGE
jgi:hypothetical protein